MSLDKQPKIIMRLKKYYKKIHLYLCLMISNFKLIKIFNFKIKHNSLKNNKTFSKSMKKIKIMISKMFKQKKKIWVKLKIKLL